MESRNKSVFLRRIYIHESQMHILDDILADKEYIKEVQFGTALHQLTIYLLFNPFSKPSSSYESTIRPRLEIARLESRIQQFRSIGFHLWSCTLNKNSTLLTHALPRTIFWRYEVSLTRGLVGTSRTRYIHLDLDHDDDILDVTF